MKYFRDSGKKIIGYCAAGAEKEYFLSLGCDEFFVPPDGGLDLRGFSGSATFVRGVFDKIGLEPQVQRIGKYKSFGDTFNRTSLSDAQREVISSLLSEASDFWADKVATRLDKPVEDVKDIWSQAGIKTPYQWLEAGFVTGVSYLDQVEERVRLLYRNNITINPVQRALVSLFSKNATSVNVTAMLMKDEEESSTSFDLTSEFTSHSRRVFNSESIDASATTIASKETCRSFKSVSFLSAFQRNGFMPPVYLDVCLLSPFDTGCAIISEMAHFLCRFH
jgi:hypothetical protein